MSDLSNFGEVFAETLPPDLQATFDPSANATAIWDMVLATHVQVLDPPMFVRFGDKKLIGKEAFNGLYNPIVNDMPNTDEQPMGRYRDMASKFAISTAALKRASRAVYEPGQDEWIGTTFNMWRGPNIEPLAERPSIIIEHFRYLFPDKREKQLVMDWLKWAMQHPDKKMTFALLIIGRYGTGKSWFSKLMQSVFGRQNVLVLPKGEVALEKFNAEHANKQLIFVDELVPNEKTGSLADALAPKIVGGNLWIEPKGINRFEVANRFNIFAVSNHETAVKIAGRNDRKWLIVRATDDLYGSDDEGKPTDATRAYYDRLHAITPQDGSITDEVRRFVWWLQTRPLREFNGIGVAPETFAKDDVAAATESTIESEVNGLYANGAGPFRFKLMTIKDVLSEVTDDGTKKAEAECAAAMTAIGCRRIGNKQVYLTGRTKPRRLWCRDKTMLAKFEQMAPIELAEFYKAERRNASADDTPDEQGDFGG
jgi:Family of unknown function (DUF5906)